MVKAIFDTRPASPYDDGLGRYHFPTRYLQDALATVSDWIVEREPQREGGRRAYVAVARVERIVADEKRPGYHYAILADFLPFDRPVAFRGPDGLREAILRDVNDSRLLGRTLQGRSIRRLEDADFAAIVSEGFLKTFDPSNARRLYLDTSAAMGVLSLVGLGQPNLDGRMIERAMTSRVVRDAAFRRAVLDVYDETCAVTGLRIINGGGRAEAQAAHILPVADGGPDVVRNGIALSATAHWLFDRRLISIGEDWSLLISHNRVPSEMLPMFARHRERIRLPNDSAAWPRPDFVAQHRERFVGL